MLHLLKILNFFPLFRSLLQRLLSLVLINLILLTSPLYAETQTYCNNFSLGDFNRVMAESYQEVFPRDLAEILASYSIINGNDKQENKGCIITQQTLSSNINSNNKEMVISIRDENGLVVNDKNRYEIVSFDVKSTLGGTISKNNDLTFKYRWLTPWLESDQFNYTLSDRSNNVNTEVRINIVPILAVDDQATVQVNSTATLKILDNDVNLTDQGLIIHAFDQKSVQQGSISQANNTLIYTPKIGFIGTDSFTYEIQTTSSYSPTEEISINNVLRKMNKATVTISVQRDAITLTLAANDDEFSIVEGKSINADVLDNDQGTNNTTVTFTQPNNGTLSNKGAGSFSYTPNANFVGTDSFSYTITDRSGNTESATVKINVSKDDTKDTINAGSLSESVLWLLFALYLLHLGKQYRTLQLKKTCQKKSIF